MADFIYEGSGSIIVNNPCCPKYGFRKNFIYKFKVGDTPYIKYRAQMGKLEKVTIKTVKILGGAFSYDQMKVIYIDTYNFLYNENELIWDTLAVELAKEWYEKQVLLEAERSCLCPKSGQVT